MHYIASLYCIVFIMHSSDPYIWIQYTVILPITKLLNNYTISNNNKHKIIIHMVYQNNSLTT